MGALSRPGWQTAPVGDETVWMRVEEESAVGAARRAVVTMAGRLGFPEDRMATIAIAVTEIASNQVKHAREGVLTLRVTYPAVDGSAPTTAAVECVAIDAGPGIADVTASLRDGHSTTGTLGIGLGAIRRIADDYDLHSVPGRGTVVRALFRAEPGGLDLTDAAGLTRPITGEIECGDFYTASRTGEVIIGALCDGLGHGPLAAIASREAIRVIQEAPPGGPAVLLEHVHKRIGHTRGGALSIVQIDLSSRSVRFAGLGNVAGWIVGPDERHGMVSVPGIAGHQARSFREFSYVLPPNGVVILHSDGLTGRWNLADYPGLLARHPLLISATLLRDAAVRRDDAGVLVVGPVR